MVDPLNSFRKLVAGLVRQWEVVLSDHSAPREVRPGTWRGGSLRVVPIRVETRQSRRPGR